MSKFESVIKQALNESQPTRSLEYLDNLNTRLASVQEDGEEEEADKKTEAMGELAGKARQTIAFLMEELTELYKKYNVNT